MTHIVLIPSASTVPRELEVEFGPIASCMVPVSGRPALQYLIDRFAGPGRILLIGVHPGVEDVAGYAAHLKDENLHVLDVGATTSLSETVQRLCLEARQLLGEEGWADAALTLNFGDTLVADQAKSANTIFFDQPIDMLRWSSFITGPDGSLGEYRDRHESELKGHDRAFCGLFQFASLREFSDHLDQAMTEDIAGFPPFYRAVFDCFNDCDPLQRALQKANHWYDLGHLDTYYASRRNLGLNARAFNMVMVDDRRGTLTKKSRSEKFRDEITWQLTLPRRASHLAPRIFHHDLKSDPMEIEMEYYGYPSVNDMLLYGRYDLGTWTRLFNALGDALDLMAEFRAPPAVNLVAESALYDMYVTKTLYRLTEARQERRFAPFTGPRVVINGQAYPGVDILMDELEESLSAAGLLGARELYLIHGDLCASNILFDTRNSFIRLLDPRGSFGDLRMYGDGRYELAKLCHSFQGHYDFLVNGLFQLEQRDGGLHYQPRVGHRHREISRLFGDWLQKRCDPAEFNAIKLIEALLFLSMIPLHDDRPDSQRTFMAHGLQQYWHYAPGGTERIGAP